MTRTEHGPIGLLHGLRGETITGSHIINIISSPTYTVAGLKRL